MAINRSIELSKDVTRAAKSRKKKALSDFLKALSEVGVSKRRSAIPRGILYNDLYFFASISCSLVMLCLFAGEREMFDRFKHPIPCLDEFWGNLQVVGSLPKALTDHSISQWVKSNTYHVKTLAQVQKLIEEREAPPKDITSTERTAIIQYSQHALYLVHQQRNELNKLVELITKIGEVGAILQSLPEANLEPPTVLPFPPQKETAAWRSSQAKLLER